MNHRAVGPEHIFLALVGQDGSVAGVVLARLGVKSEAARQLVESTCGRGDVSVQDAEIRYSPGVKRLLKLALDEARGFSHNYIGTEHLLLALFRIEGWVEGRAIITVLQQFNLNAERTRELLVQELASRTLPDVGARNNVLMCRVGNPELEAIDTLVEAGVRATRSDAAAWLIRAGIDANKTLFERLQMTVAEIRRLREQAQALTQQMGPSAQQSFTQEGNSPTGGGPANPVV